MTIAKRIRQVRKDAGLTIKELSSLIDVPEQTISKYEREERAVSTEYLNKLRNQFKVNVNWVLTGQGLTYQKDDSAINKDLLREIMTLVEIVMEENRIDLSIDKKSRIIALAYKQMISSNIQPSKGLIKEIIEIAA